MIFHLWGVEYMCFILMRGNVVVISVFSGVVYINNRGRLPLSKQ